MPLETLPDILSAFGGQADTTDPNPLDDREAEIWARIKRGPRERARELTAEGWKDRYGITEKSGKLARIMAGLGEAGRSIATGKNYRGIADEAQDRALKEYQAEVGPLQRELGVISAERRANAALQSRDEALKAKTELDQEKLALQQWVARKKAGQKDSEIEAAMGLSKARADYFKSLTGMTDVRTENLRDTGGLTGVMGAAMLQSNRKPEQTQSFLDRLNRISQLQALARGASSTGSGGQGRITSSVREQKMENGDIVPITSTSVSRPLGAAGTNVVNPAAIEAQRQALISGAPMPTVPSAQQQPGTPTAARPATAPTGLAPMLAGPQEGIREFQVFDPKAGAYYKTNIHPTQALRLQSFIGKSPLPAPIAARFQNRNIPAARRQTAEDKVSAQLFDTTAELFRSASDAYANDTLKDLTGLWPNVTAKFKAMQSGGLSFGDIQTRGAAVNAMAQKILDLSGKAVTESERRTLSVPLPNLATDADTTLLAKTILMQRAVRRLEYQKELRLNPDEFQKVLRIAAPELEKTTRQQLQVLEALKTSARNGKGKDSDVIQIPAAQQGQTVSMTRAKAKNFVQYLQESEYKAFTKALQSIY